MAPVGRVAAQDHDRLELGELGLDVDRVAQHLHVVGVEEAADGHERADPGLAEDVRGLATLEAGVQGDEHPADRLEAERGDDPLEAVRGPDRDPVAGLDADREERRERLRRRPRRAR